MLECVQGTKKEHGWDGLGGTEVDNLMGIDFHIRQVCPYQ